MPGFFSRTAASYSLLLAFWATTRMLLRVRFGSDLKDVLYYNMLISSPMFQYEKLKEAMYLLFEHGVSPYVGENGYRLPPITLVFFSLASADVLNFLLELLTAAFLVYISRLVFQKHEETPRIAILALFLLNPVSILAWTLRSIDILHNFLLISSLALALGKFAYASSFFLAIASVMSIHPVILAIPLSILQGSGLQVAEAAQPIAPKRISKYLAFYALNVTLVMATNSAIYYWFLPDADRMEWFKLPFLAHFNVEDIRPNAGAFWYFFAEVFEDYKTFYISAFMLVYLSLVPPMAYTFGKRPLMLWIILYVLTALFKFYPSVFDWIILIPVLIYVRGIVGDSQEIHFYFFTIFFAFLFQILSWRIWSYTRGSNANLLYIPNVVYVFGEVWMLSNLVKMALQADQDRKIKED